MLHCILFKGHLETELTRWVVTLEVNAATRTVSESLTPLYRIAMSRNYSYQLPRSYSYHVSIRCISDVADRKYVLVLGYKDVGYDFYAATERIRSL